MILSDQTILRMMDDNSLVIEPLGQNQIQPASVDIRLGNTFSVVEDRLFIQNAGWVDPGFQGEITLELFNANRCAIELTSGRRVGQLVFARMDASAIQPYNGKYQGQRGATGSRVFLDAEQKAEAAE